MYINRQADVQYSFILINEMKYDKTGKFSLQLSEKLNKCIYINKQNKNFNCVIVNSTTRIMDNKSHHCNKNNAAPKIKTHEYYLRVGENVS